MKHDRLCESMILDFSLSPKDTTYLEETLDTSLEVADTIDVHIHNRRNSGVR
jgi:hypothetical protein